MTSGGGSENTGWKRWGRCALLVGVALVSGELPAPAQNLWDLFSRDYVTNVQAWTRHNDNPVVSPSGSTWKRRWTASPEFLVFKNRTFLYYCGNGVLPGSGQTPKDRIGVAEITDVGPMRLGFRDLNNGFPVVDVGRGGDGEADHAQSPAAVVIENTVFLYYTVRSAGSEQIGLSMSQDGETFTASGKVLDGKSPDVVIWGDTLYMLYQKRDTSGTKVYLALSLDGRTFVPVGIRPVFSGTAGRWDGKSVTTPRVWRSGAWFYMMYGGSTDFIEEPEYFGLARSRDLISWEPHPGNPVFGAGARGSADGGMISSPAVFEAGSWFVLLYEGSRGRQNWDRLSSICMAWIAKH